MIAAQQGYMEIVKLLIEHHANIGAEDKDGANALWIASQQGHADIVELLLKNGAKSFSTRPSGRRPIHQATQNGHFEATKLLLEYEPGEVDVADKKGWRPLTFASQREGSNRLDMMKYLIEKGAKVSNECRRSRHDDQETTDDSTGETDSEESESDDGGSGAQSCIGSLETAPTTTPAAIDNTAQVQTSPSANQSLCPLRRNLAQREDEGDGDNENNHPRKRQRRKPRGVDPPKQRFACPYQAYEQGRDCFKPSQRNPRGGCDNISRLR
ncbi:hypothetical protein Neosp_003164 [[Neocosmospora] mangrovei]